MLMPLRLETRIEELNLVAPKKARAQSSSIVRTLPSVAAGADTEILISFCPIAWPRVRMKSRVRITDFEWNNHFCDEQIKGPFKHFDHRHTTRAEVRKGVQGTLVTDAIEYSLPFGAIGGLANGMIRHQLETMFAYRQQRLSELLTAISRLSQQCG